MLPRTITHCPRGHFQHLRPSRRIIRRHAKPEFHRLDGDIFGNRVLERQGRHTTQGFAKVYPEPGVVSIKKANSSNSCQRPRVASYWRRKYHTQRAQGTLSQPARQSAGIGLTRSSRGSRSWGAGSASLGLCVSVLTMAREGPPDYSVYSVYSVVEETGERCFVRGLRVRIPCSHHAHCFRYGESRSFGGRGGF